MWSIWSAKDKAASLAGLLPIAPCTRTRIPCDSRASETQRRCCQPKLNDIISALVVAQNHISVGVHETIFHHQLTLLKVNYTTQLIYFNLRARCVLTHFCVNSYRTKSILTDLTWNHSVTSSTFFATHVLSFDVQQAVSSLHR